MQATLPVAICGFASSRKSYIECAIGKAACRLGYKIKYMRMQDMFSLLAELDHKDVVMRFSKRLANYDLLTLNEWLSMVPSEQEINLLFELAEKRRERVIRPSPEVSMNTYQGVNGWVRRLSRNPLWSV